MADIETLSEDERSVLDELGLGSSYGNNGELLDNGDVVAKALRIIDAQAERLRSLEALGNHDAEALVATAERLAKVRQRISELEAQVLASETVSKAEYQAMVQQRDTMRQERNAAREEAGGLRANLSQVASDLEEFRKNPEQTWWLEEVLFELGPGVGKTREAPKAESPELALADRMLRHARALAELVGHVSGQSPPATEEIEGAIDYARYEGRDSIAEPAKAELAVLLARIADLEAREVNASAGALPSR